MPGNVTWFPATVIASEATTKNHPPVADIMMFHTSCGMAKGTSRRQNLRHAETWYMRVASSRSSGTVRNDWYRLNVMFQACDVNTAKIEAHSTPSRLCGNSAMKPVTVMVRKLKI